MIRAAMLLARNDLRLERRFPQLTLAMALFSGVALTLFHFAAAVKNPPLVVLVGLLAVTLMLAALLAVSRVFSAERDDGLLDALLLSPISRVSIWLGKAFVIGALLLVTEVVALPLFWLFFVDTLSVYRATPQPAFGRVALALLVADIGLAALGAIVAIMATATRGRDVLVPVLFLPSCIPLLIGTIGIARGGALLQPLQLVLLYDAFVIAVAYGVCEHVLTE